MSPNTEPFDPTSVFLDLKFRKKGPLVELKKGGEGVPVYFIHELMGDVSCYHRIVKEIEAPVFGIQVPFLERKSSTIPTIEDLASKHVQVIIKHRPEGPVRIVGYSGGSTLALEVSRQLTLIGRQPQILVNIDQPIENARGMVSPYHSFWENLYYWLRNEPKWPVSKFAGRLKDKVVETFLAVRGRAPPNPVHSAQDAIRSGARSLEEGEFIQRFYELLYTYIPPRSYSGRVLSFVSTQNDYTDKLIKSWKSIAQDSEFIFVPGDHFTLVTGPGAIEVREHIRRTFSQLPTTPTPGGAGVRIETSN
jgi:thioesterase domain-containing protein